MFYVFHGEDEFTQAEELGRLKARVQQDGVGELNISSYDGGMISVGDLINACNTLPFFSDRRLIIVTNILQQVEKRASGRVTEAASLLTDYLPHLPDTTRLVFLESARLDSDKGVLKALSALPNAFVREFARLNPNRREEAARLRQWVSSRAHAKGLSIDPTAATALIESVGNDLRQLDSELEKLGGRVAYAREIRVDDVMALVTPNSTTRVYEMLDQLGMRSRSGALKGFHSLLASDPRYADGLYPLAMIVVRLSELLTIKDLAETQRLSEREVRSALKVEEWRYKRLSEQARLYAVEELTRLVHQALEIDKGLKSGTLDPILSLEMLLIEATRKPARGWRST
ncbi:MAG: DNA polymerase III subunit delta [Anaerolineae bacterium]